MARRGFVVPIEYAMDEPTRDARNSSTTLRIRSPFQLTVRRPMKWYDHTPRPDQPRQPGAEPGPPATLYRFFNLLMSRARSVTIRVRRAFSASSAFDRCASSSFNARDSIRHQ